MLYPCDICLGNISYSNENLLIFFHLCYQTLVIPVTENCFSCDRDLFELKICSYSPINFFLNLCFISISCVYPELNINPSTV